MPRGGARPGAGRKKGYKEKHTLEKEAARQLLRERVFSELGGLLDAQISNAKGLKTLVWRDKAGRFKPAKAEDLEALYEEGRVIEVWDEKPNVQAFTDLMNRSLDKPAETVMAEVTVNHKLEDRLRAGRERVAKARNGNSSRHA